MAPLLGYWKIHGIAQPIRYLLAYTGTQYDNRLYVNGPAPDFDRSDWLNDKFNLGLSFPNLPYYIDGDLKIVQSNAILRYLARKHNLYGQSDAEKVKIDIIENQIVDFRSSFYGVIYESQDFAKDKESFLKTLPASLESFSKFLGNQKFFGGENLSFVDFVVYETFLQLSALDKTALDQFENLKSFRARIEALPKISEYQKSDEYKKLPHQASMAHVGTEL